MCESPPVGSDFWPGNSRQADSYRRDDIRVMEDDEPQLQYSETQELRDGSVRQRQYVNDKFKQRLFLFHVRILEIDRVRHIVHQVVQQVAFVFQLGARLLQF